MIRLATALATAAAALAIPASAGASVVAPADSCPAQQLTQPFAQWGDSSWYTPLPGGSFEDGAPGWVLRRASIAEGNEPWHVAGPGTSSLALPPGASALSDGLCIGEEHATMRFFARGTAGTLRVDVRFRDAAGLTHTLPIGFVHAGDGAWQVTPSHPVLVNVLAGLTDSRTTVQFQFTAQGGSWRVDDVYVDPWGGR